MIAFGCALASRVTAAWPRWSGPLSTMTKTRGAFLYPGRAMTCPARSMNGLIPVVSGVEANTCPVCTSRPASSAREPLALVLVLVADGPAGRGGQRGMQAAAGIDLRLGVEGHDPATGTGRLALIAALVQVHDDPGPGPGSPDRGDRSTTGTAMA